MSSSVARGMPRHAPDDVWAVPMRAGNESAPSPRKAKITPSPAKPIALVLVDDNRLFREGLVAMLNSQLSFTVLAAVGESDAALEAVQLATPDVVVIDAGLDHGDPLRLVEAVRKEAPQARVVVTGVQADHRDVAEYLRAGVSGFIMKDDSVEELSESIRCVAAGCQVIPPSILAVLAGQISSREVSLPTSAAIASTQLTAREQQLVVLLSEGLNNKAIASRLHIAVHTVKSHVHNVLEKLALHSRLEVAAYAHAHHPAEACLDRGRRA